MAKIKRLCLLLLRLIAACATLSAAIVMATNRKQFSFLTISFEVKFTDSPAFKYFVAANVIGCFYSLVVLFVSPESFLGRFVVASDTIITLLLTSSMSAAVAIAQVGKDGNSKARWLPICDKVPNYCDHAKGAIAAGFIGLIIYILQLLYSIYSMFNDPFVVKT